MELDIFQEIETSEKLNQKDYIINIYGVEKKRINVRKT